MRFKGNGSRRSRLLPFFLCAVRVAVDPSLSVGNACDRLVNGSLPLGVEGEALLLGLGLIGGLQLGNVDTKQMKQDSAERMEQFIKSVSGA